MRKESHKQTLAEVHQLTDPMAVAHEHEDFWASEKEMTRVMEESGWSARNLWRPFRKTGRTHDMSINKITTGYLIQTWDTELERT